MATLQCFSNEIRTASGCCVAGTPGCIPISQHCRATAANPIDVLTGDKIETVIDYATAGPGSLIFERRYRSNSNYSIARQKPFGDSGPSNNRPDIDSAQTRFGKAWRSNFDSVLVPWGTANLASPSNGSRVHLITPEGDELAFIYSSSLVKWRPAYRNSVTGSWTAGRTDIDIAMNNVSGVIEVKFKNDRTYIYDTSGDLTGIRWPSGYTQSLAYDAEGNNVSVADSLGRTLAFTYDSNNLLSTMTTPEGKIYTYDYYSPPVADSSGVVRVVRSREQVISHVYYPDGTPADLSDNPKTTYHYEDANFKYALTGITDERGVRYATWSYDAQGRAVSSAHAGGADNTMIAYDDGANKVTITNPLTKQTVINYATVQDHKRVVSVQGLASANCAASNTVYAYDTMGFRNQETDAEGRVTQYVNNSRGLPTTIHEAVGAPEARTTSLTWHAILNQPTQIVAPRLTSTMTYDAAGRLTQLTQTDTTSHTVPYSSNGQTRSWAYSYCQAGDADCPVGLLKSVNGPLPGSGDTVNYRYDATGFVKTITDEVGHVTEVVTNNASGQPTRIRDANLVDTDLTYDERNRLKTVTVAGATTTYDYDPAGNVVKITRGDGSYLQYTYDDAKRVTLVANNAGEKIELGYNANGDVTSRTIKTPADAVVFQQSQAFDELGRLLRSIGAASQTTVYGYDKTNLLKTITDPRSTLFTYAYDALLRLKSETGDGVTSSYGLDPQDNVAAYTDPRSIATTYVRNGFGEVIRETSPDSGTTDYVRNALGDVTEVTDARGVVTNYTYDDAGRMTAKTFPAATAENVTYTYDAVASNNKGKGRLTGVADQSGSTEWLYDPRSNVTGETRTIEGQSYPTLYQHDNAGNISEMTYPSGRIVTFSRNALGQVSGITTKKDAASAAENAVTGITWSAMSDLVTGFTYGNGLAFSASYDLDYRIATLKVKDGALNVIALTYAYDDGPDLQPNDGINLTGITDTVTAGDSQSFWYTGLGWLQNASGPYGSYTFATDGVGNRTAETQTGGPNKTFSYPAASNRVSSETTDGTPTRSFTYDAAGNLLTGLPKGSTYSLTYNKRNRPSALKLNGTTVATYLFNAMEQLVSRTLLSPLTPVGITHYIYDTQGHLIAEAFGATAATAVITREYIWLEGMPVAIIDGVDTASPIISYVHTDHLARPIRMTDSAKATVWTAQWLPSGAAYAITGPLTQNLRFPGQYFLIEQGLAYNWHRFYDPTTGRYTQPDPLGFPDGPSRYAYALNSPLMYVDEDGRFAQFIIPALAGAGVGVAFEWLFNGECATWKDYVVAAGGGAIGGVVGRLAYLPWKWSGKWMHFSHSLPDRWFRPFLPSGRPNPAYKPWLPKWLNNSLNGSMSTPWRHFKHDPTIFAAPASWGRPWPRMVQLLDRIPDWIKGGIAGGGAGAAYDGSPE